ncbi:MAG TPA: hypothetical protein PKI94_06905 [Candidatus Gastranaerophilaceae bacterium]|nr:hypothetical protein [Candidatus Gastranaerophilaceae bacterium]
MALSWNEIKDRALKFSNEFKDARYEKGETQSFYNEFFNVFGINRRRVATFEEPVKKLGDKQGFIDLFWKGVMLVEQKSQGRDLTKAKTQALEYFPNLKDEELPRYILLSDFQTFELFDLETNDEHKFDLKDLYQNVGLFDFIAGYEKKSYADTETVNIEASELMGKLYDELKISGYPQHDLELFLTRALFCLFADDSDIWERNLLTQYIEERTAKDGSDLGLKISLLFQILNTPQEKRSANLDEHLKRFAYINGGLFALHVEIPSFNSKMREVFLECCRYDWRKVSPAIFGSLFQSVSNPKKRRELGEHYTSEQNILKLIEPLFLDELWEEFEKVKHNRNRLEEFHNKVASLKFLDPACGCGNFLVVTYRELRRLETQVILALDSFKKDSGQMRIDVASLSKLDVDNFYGIEIEEFPCKIAEVALWMTDHLMNMELSTLLGSFYTRIPLVKSAKIVNANSLSLDWNEVVKPEELNYILGNPPFIGKQMQSKDQSAEMASIFAGVKGAGVLDYVTAWYLKSAQYIKNYSHIKCAFVSTNSITQGEQVGILWNELLKNYNIKIHFAHRTFDWCNEARGNAHVHCVIIGFANFDSNKKRLFDYEDIKGEPHETEVKNINPYLIDCDDLVVLKRSKPLLDTPEIVFGNMANDGGNLIFNNEEEKNEFIKQEPLAEKYIKTFIGAEEFINNKVRYCLWLKEVNPMELAKMPMVLDRINKVKVLRSQSTRKETRELANTPALFGEIRQPNCDYIVIPRVSSERRPYIPFGFINKDLIVSDRCTIIASSDLSLFGILSSSMHITWTKYTCGRMKSDYNYSNTIVYNNFPFPKDILDKNKQNVEQKAQAVLDVRAKYQNTDCGESCSLAVLYNPETMPPDLMKAHQELDRAVDKCYGKTSFKSERERIEFLFSLYEQYTKPLLTKLSG